MPFDEEDDDDKTPAERGGPLSGIAINFLNVAADANALANSLREAARQVDRATGLSRRALLADLYEQIAALNRDLAEYGEALREEALRTT